MFMPIEQAIELLVARWPGLLLAVVYGLVGWLDSGEDFDLKKFLKSMIYLVAAGFVVGDQPFEQVLGFLAVANAKKFIWKAKDLAGLFVEKK